MGHPLIDALIDYFRSDAVTGDVRPARREGMAATVAARYLFTVDFEDGSRRKRYETLVLDGPEPLADLSCLSGKGWQPGAADPAKNIEDKVRILLQNQEAKIRIRRSRQRPGAPRGDAGGRHPLTEAR